MARRIFLVKLNKAYSRGDFRVEEMPTRGRIDIAARSVIYSLWYSDGIRRENEVWLYFSSPPNEGITLIFKGNKIKRLSPNEREIGLAIKKALWWWENKGEGVGNNNIEIAKYDSWEEVVKKLRNKSDRVYLLDKDGRDIEDEKFNPHTNLSFILGDNKGLSDEDIDVVRKIVSRKLNILSLGEREYLTTQSITIINWVLDRRD